MATTKKPRGRAMDTMLSVKLPAELHRKAISKSEETGILISFVLRKALEEWTDEKKGSKK